MCVIDVFYLRDKTIYMCVCVCVLFRVASIASVKWKLRMVNIVGGTNVRGLIAWNVFYNEVYKDADVTFVL